MHALALCEKGREEQQRIRERRAEETAECEERGATRRVATQRELTSAGAERALGVARALPHRSCLSASAQLLYSVPFLRDSRATGGCERRVSLSLSPSHLFSLRESHSSLALLRCRCLRRWRCPKQ